MNESKPQNKKIIWKSSGLFLGLLAMLLFFVVSGIISYLNTRTLSTNAKLVTHTHETLSALADILSLLKDAETSQRGYLLTGDERYLEPHAQAVPKIRERVDELNRFTVDNPAIQELIPTLRTRVEAKIAELEETIKLRRNQDAEAAMTIVNSDRGKLAMDAIREQIELMQTAEREVRNSRLREMDNAYNVAVGSVLITSAIGVALSLVVAYLLRSVTLNRARQEWLQAGQIKLSLKMSGEQKMQSLGDSALRFLAEYLGAQAGALFVNDGGFHRVATYGVPANDGVPETIRTGDGLIWQAITDKKTFLIDDVPDGYLSAGSALGKSKPRHLLIAPITEDGEVNGVLELGFFNPIDDSIIQLFERVSESIGVSVRSVKYRAHLQNLLEETQRQSEELQAQGEELRVSNEELEEQSRALRESQVRLENQQAELEQSNAQLEEQTQLLEVQKDEVSRAKDSIEAQARKLEQASKYKSDFLANMSHELRTPLNSSLILAKLLSDNMAGNLTREQVEYAETIQSAGNDLLALINDILDLSKIEAGHMTVRTEAVHIHQLTEDLRRYFQPLVDQKGIKLSVDVLRGCPETIDTDRQRLEQILRNLLSNAVKFTEKGEIKLLISKATDGRLAFAVSDTGIGIPADKQKLVFEAFQQVEGTASRRYGGTGLGLSISRQLTRLLGGELRLASELGQGSTFTVVLPEIYDSVIATMAFDSDLNADQPIEHSRTMKSSYHAALSAATGQPASTANPPRVTKRIEDDRQRLTGDSRVILLVEDDEKFSRILYDLAHELKFQCLIASTAEEGLAVAVQYLPSAVILDVGLPDNSGLVVLDRLKHDRRTRHIPVHVVSADDYSQTAFSLGAVGYLLKPVKREELEGTLKQLETRLSQRMRRVLVIEDDPVQLDSLRKLLSSRDVETVGVRSAAECLEQLKKTTYDCMVLDLTLPDASGYSLLETLSREDAYAFPPVIVYTGRDLDADEEQRLRRYSKSIIIKGAKSPERLLDEVTLFLHQVVSELSVEQQRMLERARSRDSAIEGRTILIVEDDVRNIFAVTSVLEPRGAVLQIARNGIEAIEALEKSLTDPSKRIDLVLMDVMMPVMDGITAMREIRKRAEWKKLPVIMLTAKAMKDDQENCLAAGANDYMAKPLDVEKLLSLVRVWMPR